VRLADLPEGVPGFYFSMILPGPSFRGVSAVQGLPTGSGYFFMQCEIDAYGAVGKLNAAVIGAIEHAGIKERMDVAMNGFYVAIDAPGCLANRHGILPVITLSSSSTKKFPEHRD
jgi:hypothetical protein